MSSIVVAARVLLEEFARSDWRDVHLRTRDGEIFIAKADGAGNPLRQLGSIEDETTSGAGLVVAPHVATVVSTRDLHSRVEPGEVVATLEVLGERIDVTSPTQGTVTASFVRAGDLVEYGQPLVRVAAAPES